MFDIAKKRLAWIEVAWDGVASEGEELATKVVHSFEVQIEIVDKDTLRETFKPEPDDEDDETPQLSDADRFMAVVHAWRGIVAEGRPVPFTRENVEKVVALPMFANAFEIAYMKAWVGQSEIREKNSEGSSATGRTGEAGSARKARSPRTKRGR